MQEVYRQYHFRHSTVGYYVFGDGEKLLVCFQGYGEESNQFRVLYPLLQDRFTILSIAFPFHNGTDWNEGLDLQPGDWAEIIRQIIEELTKETKQSFRDLSVAAFSMGGRIAFHLLGEELIRFEQAVLIAPDGLRVNPWYYLATQTKAGNALFKYTMDNPAWIFAIMKPIEKLGLLPGILLKFAKRYLENDAERNLLYLRWTTMRRFKANTSKIIKACTEKGTRLTLVYGKYDPIILKNRSAGLMGEKNIMIEEIEASHQLIKEKYAAQLAAYFI